MTPDPLTAGKAALEERDRIKALAQDARIILNQLDYVWEGAPHDHLIRLLMSHGFSWDEAATALDFIDWDDNRHDGESDP